MTGTVCVLLAQGQIDLDPVTEEDGSHNAPSPLSLSLSLSLTLSLSLSLSSWCKDTNPSPAVRGTVFTLHKTSTPVTQLKVNNNISLQNMKKIDLHSAAN